MRAREVLPSAEAMAGGTEDGEPGDMSQETADEDDPMNPTAWYAEPDVCGSCIAWRPEDPRPGEDVAAGECKLRPELGRVPATLKKCNIYKPRGTFRYQPGSTPPTRRKRASTLRVLRRSAEGEMVPTKAPPRVSAPQILRREKDEEFEYERDEDPPEPAVEGDRGPRPERPVYVAPKEIDVGGDEGVGVVRQALVEMVRREHGKLTREIHSKYRTGGKVIAKTADGRQVELTAERFFSMIDRLRSSLDAAESALAKTAALGDEQEDMIAQIKRMQGSFTTFNLLFQDRADYFSGKE